LLIFYAISFPKFNLPTAEYSQEHEELYVTFPRRKNENSKNSCTRIAPSDRTEAFLKIIMWVIACKNHLHFDSKNNLSEKKTHFTYTAVLFSPNVKARKILRRLSH
jgi:hypothetical protein